MRITHDKADLSCGEHDAADEQHQGQRPRRRRRSHHNRDDRHTPAQGQRQTQAPEARRENAAG